MTAMTSTSPSALPRKSEMVLSRYFSSLLGTRTDTLAIQDSIPDKFLFPVGGPGRHVREFFIDEPVKFMLHSRFLIVDPVPRTPVVALYHAFIVNIITSAISAALMQMPVKGLFIHDNTSAR